MHRPEFERTGSPEGPSRDERRTMIQDAIAGSEGAWRELHRCYNPLIISVARRYGLSEHVIEDVCQDVWRLLVTHREGIRDPLALPGWIVTTTRNEALRVLRDDRRTTPIDPQTDPRLDRVDRTDPSANLIESERLGDLEAALGELRADHRRLVRLLLADSRPSYEQISRELGMPVGSIGPTRARCLARLRRNPRLRTVLADAA